MKRKVLCSVVIGISAIGLLGIFQCQSPVAGNGSQTPNSHMVYNPGGTPAANVKVCFYPRDYDPHTGQGSGTADSTTTDSSGNYSIILDSNTYNIYVEGDSGLAFQDSIKTTGTSAIHPPTCTLKTPGTIGGVVQLEQGGDPRSVFILFLGTHTFTTPNDLAGNFISEQMAAGKYKVRILTTLPDYEIMDTSFVIRAGIDSVISKPLTLRYTGIPTPENLVVSYDTLNETAILSWDTPDTSLISGYNVYRAIKGQNFSLVTQTPLPETQTMFYDTSVSVGNVYEYRVVSRTQAGEESRMMDYDADTVVVVSDSMVTTTFSWNARDTASIKDTEPVIVNFSNPTRRINNLEWYIDTAQIPVRTKIDSSLSGTDTLTYFCPAQTGLRQLIVKTVDAGNTIWRDTFELWVIQDVPQITFLTGDTIINHGGTVRCSVYVQQQFGTMTVEIDSANSGTYKILGSLGLSGGKAYSFLTGGACDWDSVKVRVSDDDGNVVMRGFKLDIKPQPLTITGIDSTDTTITVFYSQSQESDFTEYRIYRNTSNAVDTNSELWTAITASGLVSYSMPLPSYAWTPQYYRVYQKDNEGLWSAGSNVEYGCIVNNPPATPVVTYPANDGDTIWSNETLRWTKCADPNGNGVRYEVHINYNDTGYTLFRTEHSDTFVQLRGFDSLGMKFKVIAYDTLGDSSGWSGERLVNLKWVWNRGMRLIPSGTFQMGQSGGADTVHQVTLTRNFWMDTTEVTQSDYLSLMGVNPSNFKGDLSRPVDSVSWFDAVLYCNARSKDRGFDTVYSYTSVTGIPGMRCSLGGLAIDYSKNGFRLPTEAEWEYACRGGTSGSYYWGEATDAATVGLYAWYSANSGSTTHPVAGKLPNAFGLYDMSGNVLEWSNDASYGTTMNANSQTDPTYQGQDGLSIHSLRGGSINNGADTYLSTGHRFFGTTPTTRKELIGFRCVMPR